MVLRGGTHLPWPSNKHNYISGTTHYRGGPHIFEGPIHLGNKFRLSGMGDGLANDNWLRLLDTENKNYGNFATGNLYVDHQVNSKKLCLGGTCITEDELKSFVKSNKTWETTCKTRKSHIDSIPSGLKKMGAHREGCDLWNNQSCSAFTAKPNVC